MTVKQFLCSYNIGRSVIKQALVIDTNEADAVYTYNESKLKNVDFLSQDSSASRFGSLKMTTFTIEEDEIVIYAR